MDNEGLVFVCEQLKDDQFVYKMCKDVFQAYLPSNDLKIPVGGTFILDVDANRRWLNETLPKFSNMSRKSKVMTCISKQDSACYCDKYSSYIAESGTNSFKTSGKIYNIL